MQRAQVFRKHFFFPSEHGAWVWLLGPLLVGIAAGKGLNTDLVWLTVAALSAFSLRQPLTVAVKALSGRRTRAQLSPTLLWSAAYTVVLALSVALLLRSGHSRILWLAGVGAPVFAWYLWLVSHRSERDRPGVEIVVPGVHALAAPAAYWVAGGSAKWFGWTMWFLL